MRASSGLWHLVTKSRAHDIRPRHRLGEVMLHHSSAMVIGATLLTVYDTWLCFTRSAGAPSADALLVFASFGMGAVLAIAWPLALCRAYLRAIAGDSLGQRLVVGAFDGLVLAYLVSWRSTYASVSEAQKWTLGVCLIAASSLAFAISARVPRLALPTSLSVLACALWVEARLPFRENGAVHLALDLCMCFAWLSCFSRGAERLRTRTHLALVALAVVLIGTAPFTLRASMTTRGLLYDMSSHARVFAAHAGRWFSVKSTHRKTIGARRCKPQPSASCKEPPLPAPSLSPRADTADVLMLTLDAVRHDQADAFPTLLSELGAHVRFTRAVSPAPRTNQSFTAMLRGVPSRQAQVRTQAQQDSTVRSLRPTLGAVLSARGYRAVTVATHRVLRATSELAQGFEYLTPAEDFLQSSRERIPFATAAGAVLDAARHTDAPMLAWLHAIETHAPYTHDRGTGPLSEAGQRAAARDLDRKLAQYVRDFRAARPGRKLVIAVFSDHGEEFGEHGGSFHSSTVYSEQVRVMFALAAQGLAARNIDAPVSTAAVPATLLDLLGLPIPCSFSVPSLLSCMTEGTACPDLAVSELLPFKAKRRVLLGYTSLDHRLLYDRTHDVFRVFDTRRDPREQHDLARAQPELLRRLKAQAKAWDEAYCVE